MKNLKEARIAKGLSQDALAARAGVSRDTINFIENGRAVVHTFTQRKLEDALGQKITWPGIPEDIPLTDTEVIGRMMIEKPEAMAAYFMQSLSARRTIRMLHSIHRCLAQLDSDNKASIARSINGLKK